MDFISNKDCQNEEMLKAMGLSSIGDLFASIPEKLKLAAPEKDDGISEFEGMRLMEKLAAKNSFPSFDNYLGAGSYEHHVPAIVSAICSKSEFLTSYTPYQAEASQGMLQSIFEFQSCICALTGMDAANASLYDGASACAEAVLMALRHRKECNKILISRSLHPHYRLVVEQYVGSHATHIETVPFLEDGSLDFASYKQALDRNTAAVLVQNPNFFGVVEDLFLISAAAKEAGTLTIVCSNPLSYGLLASAAALNADIAVGDCQPFGLSMAYGGPYSGYIACKQDLVRQLPGRIVGETIDTQGRRGFVLTLQAREQHIRREKATSNVCTNQALAALASLVGMLWYGKQGIHELALTNFQRTAYLMEQVKGIPGVSVRDGVPHFNEFVVRFSQPLEQIFKKFRARGIEPGLDLGRYYPEWSGCLLVAVTETKSKQDLDRYVEVLNVAKKEE